MVGISPTPEMLRILDRYIIRELLLPFLIGLLVFTFLLLIQPLAEQGERLIAKGIKRVVFDRGGFLYHGRIRAVAEAAREAGLEF